MKIRVTKLDQLFSRYIRLRDGVCQRCYGISGLQTAHFHSRRKRSVRWNPDNSCLCCFGCHIYLDGNPLEKVEFFKKRLGDEKFDLLNIQANQRPGKVDENAEWLYLQAKIKELEISCNPD